MKKLLLAALLGSTTLGMAQQKGLLHLEIELLDKNIKEIFIEDDYGIDTPLKLNENGLFKGDIKIKKNDVYFLKYAAEFKAIYLTNNADLVLKNTKNNDFEYTGSLASENTYLTNFKSQNFDFEINKDILSTANKTDFKKKLKALLAQKRNEIRGIKLNAEFKKNMMYVVESLEDLLQKRHDISQLNNKPLPNFDFENYKGGTSKLADFKGKYLYIDIWATWCAPCKYEIPYLKKLEEKYHGKNIEFISIASDEAKAKELWQKTIKEKEMTGVQLFGNKKLSTDDFGKKISLGGIPRFILVGPDAKIIDADVYRPSDEKLIPVLDKLLN